MKVLVAGAGIGGLTAALFLQQAGIDVEIFERANAIRELGVGINMLPHAVQALADLGLMPDIDKAGIRTRALIYANRYGQTVWKEKCVESMPVMRFRKSASIGASCLD